MLILHITQKSGNPQESKFYVDWRNIRKSFQDQRFGHSSSCKHTKGFWPPEKWRQFGSKEYQKSLFQ